MKHDELRTRKFNTAAEIQLEKLEAQVEATRGKLNRAKQILESHETLLQRKETAGQDIGLLLAKIEKKRQTIELLEGKLEDLVKTIVGVRTEAGRILNFHPLQDQLDSLSHEVELVGQGNFNIPNSKFKTFQDIFTPSEARVLPAGGRHLSVAQYDELPLSVCPVDPERIPDWFMEEFKLGNLEGLTEFQKLEVKTKAIPALREIFSHAQPMSAYAGKKSYRVLELQGHSPDHDGKIITPHYLGRKGVDKDRKAMQVFGSIYEAHRRTLYIDEGYEAEREKISGVKGRLQDVQRELIGMSKDDPRKKELSAMLASELEILQHVTNQYKADAKDILSDVIDIRDSLGRHNPGATCARLVKALGRLEKRLPEIFDKSRYLAEDKKLLGVRIDQDTTTMDRSMRTFESLCRELKQPRKQGRIYETLYRLPDMTKLTARPFSLYAQKLKEKAAVIQDGAEANDATFVRNESINAYVICKIFKVQHNREKLLRDIAASPMETTIESLLKRARGLYEGMKERVVFPDVTTSYVTEYSALEEKIRILVERLEHYAKAELSATEKLAMYERLKKYLEDINFVEILENLN